MRKRTKYAIKTVLLGIFIGIYSLSQPLPTDTTIIFTPSEPNLIRDEKYKPLKNSWGLDILISNNGFGAGGFYRHEITDELSWNISIAISDVKDDAEIEYYDIYGNNFVPGKKNRLLLIPLTVGLQYRLFKDDIVDNFRPYLTAGMGPTMMYVFPYVYDEIYTDGFFYYRRKMDFFTSLKFGRPRYTLGGFIGGGVYFGMEKGSMSGISIKYFLAHYSDGIEVMYGGIRKNFGGLFIMLTFGSMF